MNESIFSDPSVIWMIAGIIGLLLEFIFPGLIIIFFGLGALATSFLMLFTNVSLTIQLALFLSISIISLVALRRVLHRNFFNQTAIDKDELEDEFIGKQAIALTDFEKNHGRIEFKGAAWGALSTDKIKKDDRVTIIKKDSITLTVTK
ncbi:MAG: NfeD family protein [Bacteroidales bacterium]|jgi:membrane protein implicated in regulation of membrane protease activity|nr:NfeD family protein [Bacteroidales bacterium]